MNFTNVASFIGPNSTNRTFRIVRFVVDVMAPFSFVVIRTNRREAKIFKMRDASLEGGPFSNSASDG